MSTHIKEVQLQALKPKNIKDKALWGMDKNLGVKDDRTGYLMDRIWTPRFGGFRDVVIMRLTRPNSLFIPAHKICIWTS